MLVNRDPSHILFWHWAISRNWALYFTKSGNPGEISQYFGSAKYYPVKVYGMPLLTDLYFPDGSSVTTFKTGLPSKTGLVYSGFFRHGLLKTRIFPITPLPDPLYHSQYPLQALYPESDLSPGPAHVAATLVIQHRIAYTLWESESGHPVGWTRSTDSTSDSRLLFPLKDLVSGNDLGIISSLEKSLRNWHWVDFTL